MFLQSYSFLLTEMILIFSHFVWNQSLPSLLESPGSITIACIRIVWVPYPVIDQLYSYILCLFINYVINSGSDLLLGKNIRIQITKSLDKPTSIRPTSASLGIPTSLHIFFTCFSCHFICHYVGLQCQVQCIHFALPITDG